jgi:sugar lactone lactonase YvrE
MASRVSRIRNTSPFFGRGIPDGGVAPSLNMPNIRGRRALPSGRRAPKNLATYFRFGTLVLPCALVKDTLPYGPISISRLEPVGHDLHRPECVLAQPNGDLFVPDWRGGVTRITADGSQETWLARTTHDVRPNGIALLPDGSFLLASLGGAGGVWRLERNGRLAPFVTEVDGITLPPANFVTSDHLGRVWISVSTRRAPRQDAWRPDVADGFIVLVDDTGARVVADGLHYVNEVRPDPSGTWLYVVETFGRRLIRFPLARDGTLALRETIVTLGHGCFPDGFAFDDEGGIWIASLVSNRLLRLHNGTIETVLEDVNLDYMDAVERAFGAGEMRRDHLGPIPGTTLQQLTSVAFGGPDGDMVFLGSLHGRCVHWFRASVGARHSGVAERGRVT